MPSGGVVGDDHPAGELSPLPSWPQLLREGCMVRKNAAANLLKRYGAAYLLCSISLSLCSFGLIYVLVSHGIDVSALLARLGITLRFEKLGTVGLAYALHKAASPIRFAPTVALTALVARRIEGWRARRIIIVDAAVAA